MAMATFKKGDEVIVITGKDKGKTGEVQRVFKDGRLLVSDVNMQSHYVKANPNEGVHGGIQRREGRINHSNVMHLNPATNKGDRIGIKVLEDGRKVRYFKKTGDMLDKETKQ